MDQTKNFIEIDRFEIMFSKHWNQINFVAKKESIVFWIDEFIGPRFRLTHLCFAWPYFGHTESTFLLRRIKIELLYGFSCLNTLIELRKNGFCWPFYHKLISSDAKIIVNQHDSFCWWNCWFSIFSQMFKNERFSSWNPKKLKRLIYAWNKEKLTKNKKMTIANLGFVFYEKMLQHQFFTYAEQFQNWKPEIFQHRKIVA